MSRWRSAHAGRGAVLIQAITATALGAVVLGIMVPLYLEGQRQAEWGTARARMVATGREVSTRLAEDIRQANSASGTSDQLRLTLLRVDGAREEIRYRFQGGVLTRERLAHGRLSDRQEWGSPLTSLRFRLANPTVEADLRLSRTVRGRYLELPLSISATRRPL